MDSCCLNCANYVNAKNNKMYEIIKFDGIHFPEKKYLCDCHVSVKLNMPGAPTKYPEEEKQLSTKICGCWKEYNKPQQLSLFD